MVTGGGMAINFPKAPEVLIKKVANVSSKDVLDVGSLYFL